MLTVRPLSPTEVTAVLRADRVAQARYDALVAPLAAGDWIEIVMDLSAESAAVIQRGFTAALRRRGLDVQFMFSGERMYARVDERWK